LEGHAQSQQQVHQVLEAHPVNTAVQLFSYKPIHTIRCSWMIFPLKLCICVKSAESSQNQLKQTISNVFIEVLMEKNCSFSSSVFG
jgi:hypothetical protein